MNKIRYFKFTDPYYALIKAKSEEEALTIYKEELLVGLEEDEAGSVIEISKITALKDYCNCVKEHIPESSFEDLIKDFKNPNNYILLIDGDLT